MVDHIGHALAAWLVPINLWTAALLASAWAVDRAFGHRLRASLRIALYAPIGLRVVLPLSWSIPALRLPSVPLVLPVQSLSAGADSAAPHAALAYAALGIAYLAVAASLALRAIVRRHNLARALESAAASDAIEAPCAVLRHPLLGPMVVGLVAPRIVLPGGMLDGTNDAALACVLKHEIAHVRRGDPWLSAAMELLLVMAWPVAPLWIAASRVRHLMELACDEAALSGADATERRRYGHVLLDVAAQRSFLLSADGALHFGSTLRARIEAIASQRPWSRTAQLSLISAAVVAFAACSSAGPGAVSQTTGTRSASEASSVDRYGYQFEGDALTKERAANAPPPGDTKNSAGRLAPEVIQGVVHQSFGRFRTCYETALKSNAKLEGTVTVAYTIAPDGSVKDVTDRESTMPDKSVVACVVDGFGKLAFPPPTDGYVTVVYPIVFSPND